MDNRAVRLAAILILLCAALFRLYRLDFKSLDADEIYTVAIADPGNTVLDVLSIPLYNTPIAKPALYFLITHFFLRLKDHDFLLRFPSLAFGILGVAATYAVGTKLFGRKEGLIAAFLLCFSLVHIRYSQMARFYPLLLTLSLLSLYFLYRAMFAGGARSWVGFVVATALNLYTHLFAFFVLLSLILFFVLTWLRGLVLRRRSQAVLDHQGHTLNSRSWVDTRRSSIFILVTSLVIIALAYLPMAPHLLDSLTGPKGIAEEPETPGLELSVSFLRGLLAEWSTGPGVGSLIFLMLFLAGFLASLRNRRTPVLLVTSWMVVPFVALFALPLQHRFYPRYLVFLLPVYLIVVARGLTACDSLVAWTWEKTRGEKYRSYRLALALGLVVLGAASLPALQSYYAEIVSDWRSAAVLVGSSMSPGEIVVVSRPEHQVALLRYDGRLEAAEFRIVRRRDPLPPDLPYQEGVWFVDKEGRGSEMSQLEDELAGVAGGALIKTVFEGYGDHAAPGAGESMFFDVWVLHAVGAG
ncbi:MAG: hypothetical protein GTN93_35010 [Anaerolineae bacterium]|nr:hypothetical protein [Anaerolineae bacterium]NIQ83190.1 hypothetical protein [Anaerolineae bacterium]